MLKVEIKKIICSLTFLIFAVAMIGAYITQMMAELDEPITKPQPGLDFYGTKEVENAELIMPAATESLLSEYLSGFYQAYPVMFYKEVHLKEADTERIASILHQLTGLTKETLDGFQDYQSGGYILTANEKGEPVTMYQDAVLPEYELNGSITYDEFKKLMKQADKIIGGGSKYALKKLVHNFSGVPMTYEEAVEEYQEITTGEHIGECYTRLFCDYMGVFVAIIAVFVGAYYWSMDKRAKACEVIYTRRIGTAKLILVRISALMLCMLPVILLPYIHMMFCVNSLYQELQIQWGKAFLEMLLWMIPEILFVTVLSTLITELLSPFLSIFIQGVWWYMSLQMNELVGGISKWSLLVRHNTLGEVSVWNNEWTDFVWNRLYYLCFGILVMICLIVVYDIIRRGRMRIEYKGIRRNHHKESVACI